MSFKKIVAYLEQYSATAGFDTAKGINRSIASLTRVLEIIIAVLDNLRFRLGIAPFDRGMTIVAFRKARIHSGHVTVF